MLLLMSIVNDVQNNGCNKHMDNYVKSKLVIHLTHLTYYLHRRILAPEYFEYLDYNEITRNISLFLGLMPQCQKHEQPKKNDLTQSHLCQQILKPQPFVLSLTHHGFHQ